jgi:hypothetical protein
VVVGVLCAVAPAVVLVGCGGGSSGAGQPVLVTTVSAPRALPADFLGFNAEALTAPGGLWSRPRFRRAVAALRPEALRLFGGTTANFWDWRAATFTAGPLVPAALSKARAGVRITLAEWARLVRSAGATPIYDLNLVTSTLAQQLAMLKSARALGLAVTRAELGNELYLRRYSHRFGSGADYGRVATRWISTLKAAFPELRIAVPAWLPGGLQQPDARARSWDASMLTTLRGEDALAFHPYFASGLQGGARLADSGAPAIMLAAPARAFELLRGAGLDSLPAGVVAWVTEFNLFDRRAPVHGTWGQGLDVAAFVLALLGDTRIDQVDEHALVYSAPFAALFTDRSGLDFGAPDRAQAAGTRSGFRSPVRAPIVTTPYATSASGTAMGQLLQAMRGQGSAAQLAFTQPSGAPAPEVQGTLLGSAMRPTAVLINLQARRVSVRLPSELTAAPFHALSASPGAVVTGPGSLRRESGRVRAGVLRLAPYSLVRLG